MMGFLIAYNVISAGLAFMVGASVARPSPVWIGLTVWVACHWLWLLILAFKEGAR